MGKGSGLQGGMTSVGRQLKMCSREPDDTMADSYSPMDRQENVSLVSEFRFCNWNLEQNAKGA